MNGESLQTSFWAMVFIQTIGAVDMPGSGPRKMPAPRSYVAVFVAWLVLHFIAGISANAQRAATAVGWLLVLTGLVVGPFGSQLVKFFNTVGTNFNAAPASVTQPSSTTPSTGSVSA